MRRFLLEKDGQEGRLVVFFKFWFKTLHDLENVLFLESVVCPVILCLMSLFSCHGTERRSVSLRF